MKVAPELTKHLKRVNNSVWLDSVRILLGLFLFVKGILFLEHCSDVLSLFSSNQHILPIKDVTFITSTIHIIGGLMIVIGFLTRFWILCQLPILGGALLMVNLKRGIHIENIELWLSILVTGLLILFLIKGPGRYSVDHKVLRQGLRDLIS